MPGFTAPVISFKKEVDKEVAGDSKMLSRHYVFTLHVDSFVANPDRGVLDPVWDPVKDIDRKLIKYLIANREVAPTTGQKHWQGYLELSKPCRFKAVWAAMGTIKSPWFAVRKAKTNEEAIHYCKKPIVGCECEHCKKARSEGALPDQWVEWGICSKGQGARTDITEVSKAVTEGMTLKNICLQHGPTFIKYHGGIERMIAVLRVPVAPAPEIELRPWQEEANAIIDKGFMKRQGLWIHSVESGTGKSTYADYVFAKYGSENVLVGSWKYDDMLYAYQGHKVIVFNIPRGTELHDTHLAVLEKVTDGGMQLSTKYATCMKLVRAVVIICANTPPPLERLPKRFVVFDLDKPNPSGVKDDGSAGPKAWIMPKDIPVHRDPRFAPTETKLLSQPGAGTGPGYGGAYPLPNSYGFAPY